MPSPRKNKLRLGIKDMALALSVKVLMEETIFNLVQVPHERPGLHIPHHSLPSALSAAVLKPSAPFALCSMLLFHCCVFFLTIHLILG